MKTILMLKYGTKYSKIDVDRIIEATGGKYNYVCITDDTNLDSRVKVIPLPDEIEGHWYKVWMFGLEGLGDVLYLDLDVRLQKNVDHLWKYIDDAPTICYTYWKNKEFPDYMGNFHSMQRLSNYNSSVILWRSGTAKYILDHFNTDPDYFMVKYFGDDRFLWHEHIKLYMLPPGECYSFNYGADYYGDNEKRKYRPEYTIALLNGLDKFPDTAKVYDDISNNQMG